MLLIASCSTGAEISTGASRKLVDEASAFVIPSPGTYSIVGVVQQQYANATWQEISLATNSGLTGQNWIRVTFFGPGSRSLAGQTSLPSRALALGNIDSEIRRAIPGVRLGRSSYYVQNRYGPFGYARGSRGGDNCLFGWQRLTSRPSLIGNKGSIEIRVRICDRDANEQQLLSMMYGYTIAAYFADQGWNPYGKPLPPSATLGTAGEEIRPGDQSLEQRAPDLSDAPRLPPRRVRRAPPPVVYAPPQPQPRGPAIPPPPISNAPPLVIPAPVVGPDS